MFGGDDFLQFAGDAFLFAAAGGCLYLLLAGALALTFRARSTPAPAEPLPVSILVPLCGDEPGLADRLRALSLQDYAAPVQIICGVRSESDSAIDVVKGVMAEGHPIELDLQIDPRTYGRNLKISNLINMTRAARHDTLVLVDSDIEVAPEFLTGVVGALHEPGVGAVSSFYRAVPGGSGWQELAALATNTHFLPDAIVALRLKLGRPTFGASIAMTRKTLQLIGGFPAFADLIWDDHAIGEAVRAIGLKVAIAPATVSHISNAGALRELFGNELRAAQTARAIAPLGHAGRFIVYPLPLALIAALLGAGEPAVALVGAALAGRATLSLCFMRRFGGTLPSLLYLPAGELIVFAAYVSSWFRSASVWRGQQLSFAKTPPANSPAANSQ